jgi:N6-adenosine-specific RNA methylase IME4
MLPPLLSGLPTCRWPVGLVDNPWRFKVRSRATGLGRSPDRHYPTMPLEELAALPVGRFFRRDAYLFFCVTGPFFAAGAHVPIARAWGFDPTAVAFVWVKPVLHKYQKEVVLDDDCFAMKQGFTTRQNAEYVVLCRRGDPPPRLSKSIRQVIVEPAREHSRKPEKLYRRIEAYARGPYLELFGRATCRPGWTIRGDEVGKFDDD